MSLLRSGLLLAGLAMAATASAATLRWPGSAPCDATLQACIDAAANGDTVEVASNAVIDESLALARAITLRAVPGFAPHLAQGRTLVATSPADADFTLDLEGLTLDRGTVIIAHTSARPASVRVTDLTVTAYGPVSGIEVRANVDQPMAVELYNNRILTRGSSSGAAPAILVRRNVPSSFTLTARVLFNRINAQDLGQDAAILVGGAGTTQFDLFGNQIRGPGFNSGIAVQPADADSTLLVNAISNVITGQRSSEGSPAGISIHGGEAHVTANLLNNTVVYGDEGLRLSVRDDLGGTLDGAVENNLVAFNTQVGIEIDVGAGATNQANLTWANGSDAFTPGPGTLHADPLLLNPQYPRGRSAVAPEVDAGSPDRLLALLPVRALPSLDAGGSRRIKDAGIDIGGYEYGDYGFLHQALAPSGNQTVIQDPPPDAALDAAALPLVTSNWNPAGHGGGYLEHYTGLQFLGGGTQRWAVFTEDAAAMPEGVAFNVFRPAAGPDVFAQLAGAGNTTGSYTTIDNPAVNGRGDRFLLATHDWNGAGSPGVYENHAFGVFWFSGRWSIANLDAAPMATGTAFHVYSQDPSPNAYVHVATPANSTANYTLLDHRLLNGNACARVLVTPNGTGGVYQAMPIGVFWSASARRWAIFNQQASDPPPPIAAGASFNVFVDEAQIDRECADALFTDGFDGF